MKKNFFSLLFFIFLTGYLFVNPVLANEPEQKFQGFNLQGYNDSGEKSWDVNGDTADIQGTVVKLSNVVANAYGAQKMNVTAQTGTIDQANGNMNLEKDVIVTAQNGAQLMTDSLQWDRGKDLVSTNDKVVISDDKMTATGKGMTAQPGLKNAEIRENVAVRVDTRKDNQSPSKILTITSDGPMTIDQAKSVATFEVNVVAVRDQQTLKADRMEIYFDSQANTIKQMVCIGNVEITQGENKTYAEKATYDAITKKITLSGRPKLILLTEGQNGITAPGD